MYSWIRGESSRFFLRVGLLPSQEKNILSSRVRYSILFHTRPSLPFHSEKRAWHVFFSWIYYKIKSIIIKIVKKTLTFTFPPQILLSPRKLYFRPANEICGKYVQLLPRFSRAKVGHLRRVWNKIWCALRAKWAFWPRVVVVFDLKKPTLRPWHIIHYLTLWLLLQY